MASNWLYISAASSDGTSISLLEAMYFKSIPILIDLPANREWIQNNENGFIVQDIESDFFNRVL